MAYTYGAFTPASDSAYSVWGSTGAANPYYTTPNVYNPTVPEQPVVSPLPENVRNVLPGGDSSWVDPQTGSYTPLNLNFDSLGINPGSLAGTALFGPLGGLLGGLGYGYFFGEQEPAPIVDKSYSSGWELDSSGGIDFGGQDYVTIDGVGVANPDGAFGYGGYDEGITDMGGYGSYDMGGYGDDIGVADY